MQSPKSQTPRSRTRRFIYNHAAPRASAFAIAALTAIGTASAGDLPPIKADGTNGVPACATPGRLQAYLKQRNPKLDPRFEMIAVDYMRQGEALGMRWDYAFYQMMRETGALAYDQGARFTATPEQNNFAGLRPVGSETKLEEFPDVATGVRAHLEHLLFYAGDRVADPVSKRTRKQQETDVLGSWHKSLAHPVTYADLAAKWTDGSRTYANLLEKIATAFTNEQCDKPDPNPEYVAAAGGIAIAPTVVADAVPGKTTGAALARRAVVIGGDERSGLGAGAAAASPPAAPPAGPAAVHVINPPVQETAAAQALPAAQPAQGATTTKIAAAGASAKPLGTKPDAQDRAPAAPLAQPAQPAAGAAQSGAQKCRVWTASYGGRRAVIVKSTIDQVANFTVLDVNEGQEAREAEAFIAAYAKGGAVAGEFATQDKALEKAFELCPEG